MAKKLNIFRLENGYLLLVDRTQKATGGGPGNEATLLLDLGALPRWFPALCRSFVKFRNVYRWSARHKAKTAIKEETPGITLIKSDFKEEKAKIQAT